jgi:short-subunit dehydrogenase
VLVLNAGRSQRDPAMDTSVVDTKALFELNFFSFVNLAKIVIPTMTSRESGGQVRVRVRVRVRVYIYISIHLYMYYVNK